MGKNKNNQPIWNTRIKKVSKNLFKKVGGSISIDKRLFREDIEASIVHVEMLFKQKIINFKIKNKIVWGLNRIKNEIIKKKFVFLLLPELILDCLGISLIIFQSK